MITLQIDILAPFKSFQDIAKTLPTVAMFILL